LTAEKLVDFIGGRLVYLESAVIMLKNGEVDQNDDEMCGKILSDLFSLTIAENVSLSELITRVDARIVSG